MWRLPVLFFLLLTYVGFGQQQDRFAIKKENLTKKEVLYFDFEKRKIQSEGAYFKDKLGSTVMKHGKWVYYNTDGNVEEERNYFKDQLMGRVIMFYGNGKPKQEGYFYFNKPDSVYREWNETGRLAVQGEYLKGKPQGKWQYYYLDGRLMSEEVAKDTVLLMESFWLPDSLHTQIVTNGTGEMVTFWPNGKVKEWYNYKDGRKHGQFEEWNVKGNRLLSGSFIDGVKDGEWIFNFYSGSVDKVTNYKNGKLHGPYKNYYEDGKVYTEGFYEEGKKTGEWVWYTSAGTRDMKGNFLADKQHGEWTYWYVTGEISYTAFYKENLKHGTWTYYYKNGKKYKQGAFKDDKKDGLWQTWYETGVLLMEGEYIDGKEDGLWKNYFENGKLKNTGMFKNGKLNGLWNSFLPEGSLVTQGKYKDNLQTGKWTDYFKGGAVREMTTYKIVKKKSNINKDGDKAKVNYSSIQHGKFMAYSDMDGKLMEEGNYKKGEKDGTWTAYHPGGKIKAVVSNYKAGKLEGAMTVFDKRGKIMSTTEYKDGLKHGSMKLYDKRGKVTLERKFSEGMMITEGAAGSNKSFSPK